MKIVLMMMREWKIKKKLIRFAVGGKEVGDMVFLFTD